MLAKIKELFKDCLARAVIFMIIKLDDDVIAKIEQEFEDDDIPAPGQTYNARLIDVGEIKQAIWTIV